MTYWYYKLGRRQAGPVSAEDLGGLAEKGTIKPDTLLWHRGLAAWVKASQAGELNLPFASDTSESTPQSLRDTTLAGPWPRFWARFLDEMITGAVIGLPFMHLTLRIMPDI